MKLLTILFLVSFPLMAQTTRINAGGPAYTDSNGNVWAADADYDRGNTYTTTHSITNTPDQALFKTLRDAYAVPSIPSVTYTIPLSNGTYQVNLGFAETYFAAVGARVFNVKLNGTQVLTNFDVFAKMGQYVADIESFPVTVSNGSLAIEFDNVTNNSIVSNLEILFIPPPHFATLSWQPGDPAGVTYNIYRSDGAVWSPVLLANVSDLTYADTTIVLGQNYVYKVTAVDVNNVESDGPFLAITVNTQ